MIINIIEDFLSGSVVKNLPQCKSHRWHGFGPWVGKIPWRRAWPPLQYSCLENPVDRRAWWATVYRVAKSWTWLKWLSAYAHTHTHTQYNWINLSSLYILALLYFFFHSFQSCLVLTEHFVIPFYLLYCLIIYTSF